MYVISDYIPLWLAYGNIILPVFKSQFLFYLIQSASFFSHLPLILNTQYIFNNQHNNNLTYRHRIPVHIVCVCICFVQHSQSHGKSSNYLSLTLSSLSLP